MNDIGPVSRILAIRLARLGDVTLLLPVLGQLKRGFPEATVTLLVGLPYAPLARLCPFVDEVIAIDRLGMRDGPRLRALRMIWDLVRNLRRHHFDLVLDFHGFSETNLLARASGGRYRTGMRRAHGGVLPLCFNIEPFPQDDAMHLAASYRGMVERFPGCHPEGSTAPSIRVPGPPHSAERPIVALYVGASVPSRRWPADRFAELANHVADRWGFGVRVLSGIGPDEADIADRIARTVGPGRDVEVLVGLEISALVRAIGSSSMLVSNDSGPMHLGAALGVPTLGIFSESPPDHYSPVGPHDRFVHRARVADVTLGEVLAVLDEMRSVLGPR